MKRLIFPAKDLRAEVIGAYVLEAGYRGVVCFSCGNASGALRKVLNSVIEISPNGSLQPGRWWLPEEIHRIWPDLFDATPGHLPAPLMVRLAAAYRGHLGELKEEVYLVPTGSGETIICLKIAYPEVALWPEYSDNPSTKYEKEAPLNEWVRAISKEEFKL